MSDESPLWIRYKNGDIDALGVIFRHYFRDIYHYGMKIMSESDVVKDVIQEMFVKLWDKRHSVGKVNNVKSYLLVMLRRELIHYAKSTSYEYSVNNEEFSLSTEDIIIESEENEAMKHMLHNEIQKLTARQREIIFLRFYTNLNYNDIAFVLEMNVQSVRNLLFRSLENIRKELRKEQSER